MSVLHRFPDPVATWLPAPIAPVVRVPRTTATFASSLLREGLLPPDRLIQTQADSAQMLSGQMVDMLVARGIGAEPLLYAALADHWGMTVMDPQHCDRDPLLLRNLGAKRALQRRILPVRKLGSALVVAVADPESVADLPMLTGHTGPIMACLCPAATLERIVLAQDGRQMAHAAETRVPLIESCRNWGTARQAAGLVACASLGLGALLMVPGMVLAALTGWAIVTLIATSALKMGALLASRRSDTTLDLALPIVHLPTVSVIVALYREARIASRLLLYLGQLDYPRDKLDVVLAVEVDDHVTRHALAAAGLPPWITIVVVPRGGVKTKPRALNYALDHCRGSIIGIYDAEDRPAADQITRVVDQFYRRGPQVACLQGVLDYYNPSTNWLARCFTIEYAGWFRVMLPGLQRLGLPIPLGGTTLFFRRTALETLGAWDAHNVTEDADLGIRLVRHGYRTELITTVTMEEANCRAIPWVRQRSRWIKGYMMTYAVHMRQPRLLLRQLGWWRFAGFQVLLLGSLSQAVLVPVLWSFWLTAFGIGHPVADALPQLASWCLLGVFLMAECITLAIGITGLARTQHSLSAWWVPTLHVYYPLAALASYKALWEMVTKPFYWDKTSHGHFH